MYLGGYLEVNVVIFYIFICKEYVRKGYGKLSLTEFMDRKFNHDMCEELVTFCF